MEQQQFDTLTAGSGAVYAPFAGTGPHYELAAITLVWGKEYNNQIHVTVLKVDGTPAFNVWVRHNYGDEGGQERFPFTGGKGVEFNLGPGSHYSRPKPPPDRILIEGGASDEVWVGNGDIIGFTHIQCQMTFQMVSGTPLPPPMPPGPPPSGSYVTVEMLNAALERAKIK